MTDIEQYNEEEYIQEHYKYESGVEYKEKLKNLDKILGSYSTEELLEIVINRAEEIKNPTLKFHATNLMEHIVKSKEK